MKKEKTITLKPKNITQKQWINLLLELNLMRKAWQPYGVHMQMKASGLKSVLNHGTRTNDIATKNRRSGK